MIANQLQLTTASGARENVRSRQVRESMNTLNASKYAQTAIETSELA
jgi:hypothetical protein